jgi:hypothetical protein
VCNPKSRCSFDEVDIKITRYGLDGPWIESRWRRDFPCIQKGLEANPASCATGTGSLLGVRRREDDTNHLNSSNTGLLMGSGYTSCCLLCVGRHVIAAWLSLCIMKLFSRLFTFDVCVTVSCRPVSPFGSWRQSWYIVPKSCIYSQSAPEDGRNCRPKHVEQA